MPPLQKSGMSRRTIALLGGIGGAGLGAALAVGLAFLGGAAPIRPAQPTGRTAKSRDEFDPWTQDDYYAAMVNGGGRRRR